MKHLALTLSIAFFVATVTEAAPVIFIVRHAEKATPGGNDPDLSVAGQKRAEALARILKDSQITAVFVTEFKRTQETAALTAKAAHVNPTVVPANDVAGLGAKVRALNGNALVVGHGNTIPEDDYSEIFAVSLQDPPQLLRLHYPF